MYYIISQAISPVASAVPLSGTNLQLTHSFIHSNVPDLTFPPHLGHTAPQASW